MFLTCLLCIALCIIVSVVLHSSPLIHTHQCTVWPALAPSFKQVLHFSFLNFINCAKKRVHIYAICCPSWNKTLKHQGLPPCFQGSHCVFGAFHDLAEINAKKKSPGNNQTVLIKKHWDTFSFAKDNESNPPPPPLLPCCWVLPHHQEYLHRGCSKPRHLALAPRDFWR